MLNQPADFPALSPPIEAGKSPPISNTNAADNVSIPLQIGHYNIAEPIGSGSYSVVHRAVDVLTGKNIAVKIISKSKIESEIDKIQFVREIQALTQLVHPNLIKFIDFLEDDNFYYVFQELNDGASLLQFLLASDSGLSENLARVIFKQLITVLIFLHQNGIFHRDIKLDNILINKQKVITLIDFGFCQFGNSQTLLKTICGSLHYLAPECIKGQGYRGDMSDIWSSGIVLVALISRKTPFHGQNQLQLIQSILDGQFHLPETISPQCADLIKRILTVDPDLRINEQQIMLHPWMVINSFSTPTKAHLHSSFIKKPLQVTSTALSFGRYQTTRRSSFPTQNECNRIVRNSYVGSCNQHPSSALPTKKSQCKINDTFVIDE